MKFLILTLTTIYCMPYFGCSSYKQIAYFKDLPDTARTTIREAEYKKLLIQGGDIISVDIETLDPAVNAIFSQLPVSQLPQSPSVQGSAGVASFMASQQGPASAATPVSGYTVSDSGFVNIPLLGKIRVVGLTTDSAANLIQAIVGAHLFKSPVVNIRLANFKVSVLGEVARPGAYNLNSEKSTIFDALSLAGDLTIFGKRTNALLIRDSAGIQKQIRFSLNSKDLAREDFYYLKQNDIIYIEPAKGKAAALDANQAKIYALSSAVLSVIIILATRVK